MNPVPVPEPQPVPEESAFTSAVPSEKTPLEADVAVHDPDEDSVSPTFGTFEPTEVRILVRTCGAI